MSARDDYPAIAIHSRFPAQDGRECADALREIDDLRRWKAEATEVIAGWERVYEVCGSPGPLGGRKSESLLEALRGDGIILDQV